MSASSKKGWLSTSSMRCGRLSARRQNRFLVVDPRVPQLGSDGESSNIELAKPELGDPRRQPLVKKRQAAVGLSKREERGKGNSGSPRQRCIQKGRVR